MIEHFATHYQVIKATFNMKWTSLLYAITNTNKIQYGYHHVEIFYLLNLRSSTSYQFKFVHIENLYTS